MPKHRCPFCDCLMKPMHGKHGPYIECTGDGCDARVGVHRDGRPKGTPARFWTRRWRMAAHTVFDSLWKGDATNPPKMNRAEAYRWLENATGVKHIAECDVNGCFDVIDAVHHRLMMDGDA